MTKSHPTPSIPATADSIERRIHLIRGQRVMLDEDLAVVYRTTTGRLNEQVSRNLGRFPGDFAFLLTSKEVANLKSQIAISSWGGRRTPPRVFTAHGAVMVASVLNTPVAVAASVYVVRAFVRFPGLALSRRELAGKLADLEGTVSRHDEEIRAVFDSIRELLEAPPSSRPEKIGFRSSTTP